MARTKGSTALDSVPARIPAADVKRLGWRGVAQAVADRGAVLVTNHNRPEAVILSTREYERLAQGATRATAAVDTDLATLRRRFDARLAALQQPRAGARLRAVMQEPLRLRGRVKAGASD